MGGTERSVYISNLLMQSRVCPRPPPAPLRCYITSHHFYSRTLWGRRSASTLSRRSAAPHTLGHTSLWYELSVSMATSLQGELWLALCFWTDPGAEVEKAAAQNLKYFFFSSNNLQKLNAVVPKTHVWCNAVLCVAYAWYYVGLTVPL